MPNLDFLCSCYFLFCPSCWAFKYTVVVKTNHSSPLARLPLLVYLNIYWFFPFFFSHPCISESDCSRWKWQKVKRVLCFIVKLLKIWMKKITESDASHILYILPMTNMKWRRLNANCNTSMHRHPRKGGGGEPRKRRPKNYKYQKKIKGQTILLFSF